MTVVWLWLCASLVFESIGQMVVSMTGAGLSSYQVQLSTKISAGSESVPRPVCSVLGTLLFTTRKCSVWCFVTLKNGGLFGMADPDHVLPA